MQFVQLNPRVSNRVWQPEINLDHVDSWQRSSKVQAYVKFFVQVKRRTRYRTCEGNLVLLRSGSSQVSSTKGVFLDLDMFKSYDYSCREISNLLGYRPEVHEDFHACIADEVVCFARKIGNWVSNMGRKVLPIYVDIIVEEDFLHDERYWITRALRESAMEFERRRYGMVPARKSALKGMLKRVRVEDCVKGSEAKRRCVRERETCTICLEEFEAGSEALCMPCTHIFHAGCIVKWLNESHYCPVCRFEVPTF
ncbi:uncharacterized protein LOC126719897 [Quercus robur]|uniref:uncharacterized protein LOC126719897 n=1 Tax=Quercus robur TaxID=38942 RepID=UPI002161B7ED|nr:uncharacterized protein LOC126719897 [Quercus robur]